jgi:hypothetical protein
MTCTTFVSKNSFAYINIRWSSMFCKIRNPRYVPVKQRKNQFSKFRTPVSNNGISVSATSFTTSPSPADPVAASRLLSPVDPLISPSRPHGQVLRNKSANHCSPIACFPPICCLTDTTQQNWEPSWSLKIQNQAILGSQQKLRLLLDSYNFLAASNSDCFRLSPIRSSRPVGSGRWRSRYSFLIGFVAKEADL